MAMLTTSRPAAFARPARIGPVLIFASVLLQPAQALAQAAPAPPTREEVDRGVPARQEPPRVTLDVQSDVPRPPCALDRPEYNALRFTLTDVVFDDLRGLSADQLRPAYASRIGQSLPVSTICEIRDRAAQILNDAGYVAVVEVPEQRIADGTLRFRVVMAKLVGLRVRGDAGRAERRIAAYLDRLTGHEVFNRYEAERYLLLAGDMPGYSVRLALRSAGTVRGEVIGEVLVQRLPALVDLTVQNYGSRELGRWGALLRGQAFGITGLGDRTLIAAYTTPDFDEQQTLQVAHDFRVGSEGLSFGAQATFAWAHPDLGDPAIDIRSRTVFASAEAGYPFIRRQNENLRGAIGLDYVNQNVEFGGLPISRDRLRVAFARLTGELVGLHGTSRSALPEPVWRLGAQIEARQGLDIFGASQPCGALFVACFAPGVVPPTRLEADPTALVFRGAVDFEARPARLVTVAASMRAQHSGSPLLSFEEFSAGNYTIGRGYEPGAILGDRGLALRGELRFGNPVPRQRDQFALEPFVFVDQAWAWNEERIFPIPRQELTSIGGGIRGAYGDRLRFEMVAAAPLDRTLFQPNRDVRILFSITTRLWPWSVR